MSGRSVLARASWGLDSGPDTADWRRFAICGVDPDRWFRRTAYGLGQAAHLCRRHCPVLAQCRADAEARPPLEGVQAGIRWGPDTSGTHGKRHRSQPMHVGHGRYCENWEGSL